MASSLQPTAYYPGKRDKLEEIQRFLTENYDIKINRFDTSKTQITPLKKEYLFPVEFKDICLDLSEGGIPFNTPLLKMLLTSPNRMPSFNPITDYLDGVRGKFRGHSHIDELCRHLTAREFDDKPVGHYQQRMSRYIKKWIVAATACALGLHPNDVALGFIAESEGMGKTHLTKFITPACLSGYRIDSIDNDDKFDLGLEFTRNLVVNFDELVGITRATTELFKQTLSADKIAVARSGFTAAIPRIASATFTTNKAEELGGFLTPSMGYRRWLCVELTEINKVYSAVIDVDQIYAEALLLIDNAEYDYRWDDDDFADFATHNRRYMHRTAAYDVVKEWYAVPEPDDEASLWTTPSEMLRELKKARKITAVDGLTDRAIGMAMRQLGFIPVRKKIDNESRSRYLIIKNF